MALVICEKQEDGSYAPIGDSANLEAAGKRIAELEAQVKQMDEKIVMHMDDREKAEKALIHSTEELLTRRTRIGELEKERDKLHTEKAEAQKKSHDMSKTVLRLEEWVAKLEKQKASLHKSLDELREPPSRDDCDQIDLVICEKYLDGTYRPIKQNRLMNKMRRELDLKEHYEGQVADRDKHIAELEARDDRPLPAISEVITLNDEVQHLKDQIAEMESEHEEFRKVASIDYRQMEDRFKEASVLLGNAEEARDVARKNYRDVRECWQESEQECKKLRTHYGELQIKFEKLRNSLSPLYEVGAACILRDAGINNEGRYVDDSETTISEVQNLIVRVLHFDATNFGEEYLVEAHVDGTQWRVSVPEDRLSTNNLEEK